MAVRWNLFLAVLLLGVALSSLSARSDTNPSNASDASASTAPSVPAPSVSTGGPTAVIVLSGEVDDYQRDALFRRFDKARRAGSKNIILQLDTYGGLVTSGLDISRFLKRQNDLHVIAFVNDKAISAGAMIAVACNEIIMSPSSTLGDCAPIAVRDHEMVPVPAAERAKMESPVVKEFVDSAQRNGYDPLLLTSMVKVETVVYCVQDDRGHKRFVDADEYKKLTAGSNDPKDSEDGKGGNWKPVPGLSVPVDDEKTLLTVGTNEALKLGLSKGQANSAEELAAGRGYTIVADLSPGVTDHIIGFLGNNLVRVLLLIIFIQALFISIQAPGHGAAEAIAVVSLGLLVGVPLLTGYAEWWDLLLIFGGLALVAFEIFVFPGHMVSAIVGSLMVVAGLLLTFVGNTWSVPGTWSMQGTWTNLVHGVYVVAGGLVCSVLLSLWLRRYLPKLPYFNRLILTAISDGQVNRPGPLDKPSAGAAVATTPAGLAPETTDRWPFLGTVGHAMSDLKPGGSAEFPYADDTRTTAVVSESGYITAGTKIVVREVSGNRVVVRKA